MQHVTVYIVTMDGTKKGMNNSIADEKDCMLLV